MALSKNTMPLPGTVKSKLRDWIMAMGQEIQQRRYNIAELLADQGLQTKLGNDLIVEGRKFYFAVTFRERVESDVEKT